jgi:hypothetical protein
MIDFSEVNAQICIGTAEQLNITLGTPEAQACLTASAEG